MTRLARCISAVALVSLTAGTHALAEDVPQNAPATAAPGAPGASPSSPPEGSASDNPPGATNGSSGKPATKPPNGAQGNDWNNDDFKKKQEQTKRAITLHDEAKALYAKGKYREAIAKLKEALELDPLGRELVYNMALIHEKLGELEHAEHYYVAYLEMEPSPVLRKEVEQILTRIRGAREDVESPEPPPPLVTAKDPDEPPPTAPEVAATPPEEPAPNRLWLLPLGVGAAGLAVGTSFAVAALAVEPGDPQTGMGQSIDEVQEDADAAHRLAIVADVGFGVAILASAAAIVLVSADLGRDRSKVSLDVQGTGGRVSVVF